MEGPELLTPDEVAAKLRLKRATVVLWLQRGKLPGIKIGGVWRIARKELDAYLEAHKRDN